MTLPSYQEAIIDSLTQENKVLRREVELLREQVDFWRADAEQARKMVMIALSSKRSTPHGLEADAE